MQGGTQSTGASCPLSVVKLVTAWQMQIICCNSQVSQCFVVVKVYRRQAHFHSRRARGARTAIVGGLSAVSPSHAGVCATNQSLLNTPFLPPISGSAKHDVQAGALSLFQAATLKLTFSNGKCFSRSGGHDHGHPHGFTYVDQDQRQFVATTHRLNIARGKYWILKTFSRAILRTRGKKAWNKTSTLERPLLLNSLA